MLELNKNTYVDIDGANNYVSSHYLSNDKTRLMWEETTENDKIVLLLNACQNIESLKFIGRKHDKNQSLSFPRNSSDEIPIEIIHAQVEEAIASFKKADAWEAYQNGLSSESIDDVSKTYNTEFLKSKKLRSQKAQDLLRGWLHGCFKVF